MELTPEASRSAWLNLQATLGPLPKKNRRGGAAEQTLNKGTVMHQNTSGHGLTCCEANAKPTPYWSDADTSSLGASPIERRVEYLSRRVK